MNTERFIALIEQPKSIDTESTRLLKDVIAEFPYCQTSHMLFLKGLQNQESFQYNRQLRVAAAYTGDRHVLFEWVVNGTAIGEKTLPKKEAVAKEKSKKHLGKTAEVKKVKQKTEAKAEEKPGQEKKLKPGTEKAEAAMQRARELIAIQKEKKSAKQEAKKNNKGSKTSNKSPGNGQNQ